MVVKLKVKHGASAGKEIKIPKPEFFIGRGDDCHLRPKSDAISRRHCVLLVNDTQVMVRDLGSRNGTYVNGDRLEEDRILKVGDHLKIGPLEFEVVIDHGLGGRDKRPEVSNVAEAAERTCDSSVVDTDVSSWLAELDEIDKVRRAADPDTRQFKLSESESVDAADQNTTEISTAGAPNDSKVPVAEEKKKAAEKKKEPGKLPKQPEALSANSRDAAAEMLKKFFNRR